MTLKARGTESLLHRGIPQGILVGVIGLLFTGLLQARGHLPGHPLVTLAGGIVLGLIGGGINRAMFAAGEKAATAVYVPSGDTTRYTPTFSHIEAMEVRGDLDGAARAWDTACAEDPTNALTMVKAADFHLRLRKDPAAALERYRKAREMGTGREDLRRYVQQKIVDLFLTGPLTDHGRAMVELRRLIDGFPGTREAEGARQTLDELKRARTEASRD